MARRSDLTQEIVAVGNKGDSDTEEPRLALVTDSPASGKVEKAPKAKAAARREEEQKKRRLEAMSLRQAGLTWDQIGERLGIARDSARELVYRNLERADNREVDAQRAIENARLDRAQAAIWTRVLNGEDKAIDTFLRISQRRARLNGLDAPQKLDLNLSIRQEMEEALHNLERVVLGEVIQETVGWGDDDRDRDPR